MDEQFRALTIDYYGATTPTCQLANIRQTEPNVLVVRPFDPDTTMAFINLGTELGWTHELIPCGNTLLGTIQFTRPGA